MFRGFFILILIACSFAGAFAQRNSLVVFSATGKRFILRVNSEQINKIPQSNVKAFDLNIGKQYLLVEFKEDQDQSVLRDSIIIGSEEKYADKEFTYALTDDEKNGHSLHRLHFITVNDTSGPREPNVPEVPREIVPLIDNSIYGILYQAKNNKAVFFDNYNDTTRNCDRALGDKEIRYLRQLMDKSNDPEIKYNEVMQTIRNNCYNTFQLKQLVPLLTTELDKLKVCKEAYWHLTDRQNARTMTDVLVYKTIQEDYLGYLGDLANIEKQQQLKCTTPVGDAAFKAIVDNINAAVYENEKIKVAHKQLVNNCLSTDQVIQLMGLFVHDREKLDFAKYAYRIVTDKDNFYKLQDSFLFKETKEEFNKYFSR